MATSPELVDASLCPVCRWDITTPAHVTAIVNGDALAGIEGPLAQCTHGHVFASKFIDGGAQQEAPPSLYVQQFGRAKRGCPQAEVMLHYAEIALTDPEPWKRLELRRVGAAEWEDYGSEHHPHWSLNCEYRIKPRTIRIGAHDVPEPERVGLEKGRRYWFLTLGGTRDVHLSEWMGQRLDWQRLERGLIHLTKGNAEAHAEALLSFTTT